MNIQHQLNHSRVACLRPAAFAVISRMQDYTPGEQVLATAVALRVMVQEAGLDLSQVLNAAERATKDADAVFTHHVQAIRDYARNELRRNPVTEARHEEVV